jgi:hypothetical protein
MTQTQSKEDIEKQQVIADKVRYDYIEGLSEENKAKFKAIEDATRQLHANGVSAYIFAMMPNPNRKDVECMIQYNTLSRILKFDETGDLTLQSKEDIKVTNESLLDAVFHLPFFQKSKDLVSDIKFLANVFLHAIVAESKRYGYEGNKEEEKDSVVPLQ